MIVRIALCLLGEFRNVTARCTGEASTTAGWRRISSGAQCAACFFIDRGASRESDPGWLLAPGIADAGQRLT